MSLLTYVQNGLTAVSKEISETKYPEIVFPQFVYVDQQAAVGITEKLHYGADEHGSLDDGLITTGTSTLDQVEVGFTPTRSYIVPWAKSVTWTTPELEQGKLLGLALDTAKIMALNKNAQQTLQKVAFLGHAKDTRLTGLLNNKSVEVYNIKGTAANTKVQAMDFDKSVAFFKEIFLQGMEKTKRIEAPNTFAIDSLDLAHLALTQRNNTDTTALEFLTKSLSAAAGREVAIKALPSNFGTRVTSGKTRAMVYVNSKEYVIFDVPMSPTVLASQQKRLISL
ncbi:hypothetical protein CGSHi22421_00987 [Haemophilus influenzae R3021]|uniref:Uncharacterized protein n=1 Tax=Haemophilus influenzae R3021 TaxID=375432 RepID=A4N6E6_HAEIF|nr:hypothetical protein CGSHi22421_00987 [Haemophilus influenzae R3021]